MIYLGSKFQINFDIRRIWMELKVSLWTVLTDIAIKVPPIKTHISPRLEHWGVLCSSSSLIIFLVVRNLVGLFTGSRLDSPLTVWWWVCFWVLKSLERCWWGGGNYFSLKPGSKRVHYMEWGVFSLHYCSFVKHVKCDSNIICYIMMISI